MMKKLALTVVLLGMALLTLTGCFAKSSREFIEGKVAELSKVYPTEDLEDLFEKFPEGFNITTNDLYDYNEDGSYTLQKISLNGDSETKQFSGKILEKRITVDEKGKISEKVVYDGEIEYQNSDIQLKDTQAKITIRHPKLLIQKFTIQKDFLSQLSLNKKSYSSETGAAHISYFLENKELSDYMAVTQDTKLKMVIYIMYETMENKAYNYTLDIQNGHNSYSETIGC